MNDSGCSSGLLMGGTSQLKDADALKIRRKFEGRTTCGQIFASFPLLCQSPFPSKRFPDPVFRLHPNPEPKSEAASTLEDASDQRFLSLRNLPKTVKLASDTSSGSPYLCYLSVHMSVAKTLCMKANASYIQKYSSDFMTTYC
ncbi:hypothetical protein D9758_013484 [Tetrapyrgos nigripes]|uniref:Uncharacterized protein n=1 Tax=Tetrapyrgos nigripes TaxID=182062 RepID=A0A8H5FRM5_9AGAR|nr:hypothetical protein D9758_013484 [Tetrapyrgos nigripes]